MTFAPLSTYKDVGDGSILGQFCEKDTGNLFEFSRNNDGIYKEFPHKIWVTTPIPGIDQGFRYGRVSKTRCTILVNVENLEKWTIKKYKKYS